MLLVVFGLFCVGVRVWCLLSFVVLRCVALRVLLCGVVFGLCCGVLCLVVCYVLFSFSI